MKKINSLLVLSAVFALSACAGGSITEAEAKERANEIVTYQKENKVGFKGTESFTYTMNVVEEKAYNSPATKESHKEREAAKIVYSYNANNNVFHIIEDITDTEDKETVREFGEVYMFVRSNNGQEEVVLAVEEKEGGKHYTTLDTDGVAPKQYVQAAAFEELMDQEDENPGEMSFLGTEILEGFIEEGIDFTGNEKAKQKTTYSSSGKGSLTIDSSVTVTEVEEGVKITESMKAKVEWKNYFVSSMYQCIDGSMVYPKDEKFGEDSGFTQSQKMELTFKLEFTSSAKAPSLSSYTFGGDAR